MSLNHPEQSNPEPGLGLEEMKVFVKKHFDEFVNKKIPEVALKNFAEDFLDHDEAGGAVVGPQAAMRMMQAAYDRWPDLHVSVEDILAEGDKVMVRNVWTATDTPTGRKISFRGFVLWRFVKGKIVERWATLTQPGDLGGDW